VRVSDVVRCDMEGVYTQLRIIMKRYHRS
jgi:hypothetical protein